MGNSSERQSIWYGNDLVGWRGQNFPYGREGLWRRGLGWLTWGGTKHDRPGDHKIRWLSREQRNVHRQPAGEGITHNHGTGNKRFQKRQLELGRGTLATRYPLTLTSRSWLHFIPTCNSWEVWCCLMSLCPEEDLFPECDQRTLSHCQKDWKSRLHPTWLTFRAMERTNL